MLLNKRSIVLPILYMALIFVLSSIPMKEDELTEYTLARQMFQNLLHIPLFGFLAFLWMRVFVKNKLQFKKALIYALLITVLYAAFDEFHQYFVPGRYATFSDFFLNVIGCLGGLFAYMRLANYKPLTESR